MNPTFSHKVLAAFGYVTITRPSNLMTLYTPTQRYLDSRKELSLADKHPKGKVLPFPSTYRGIDHD